jgi:hypothetical protein
MRGRAAGAAPETSSGNCQEVQMNKDKRLCHDRILPKDLARPQGVRHREGRAEAIILFRKLWINGSTLRVRFLEGSESQKALVREQAAWWSEHANLHFDFTDDPAAEIRIAFDPTDGAWSYLGTDALDISANLPTMNLGFLDGGTAAHEFGHAIGAAHEHQNPAGGIEWNEEVVYRDLSGPPNYWSQEQIRRNVLMKYSFDQIRGTGFDPESIMLYFFPDSWVKNGPGTQANETLSALDRAFVASEQAYPGRLRPAAELAIGGGAVEASIGVAGEEDLYRVRIEEAGHHVFETGGETDVILKLFGPDSPTALVAEDDDGGVGLNARIAAGLVEGDYLLQVRHYNQSAGTGTYTVEARR